MELLSRGHTGPLQGDRTHPRGAEVTRPSHGPGMGASTRPTSSVQRKQVRGRGACDGASGGQPGVCPPEAEG